MTPIPLTIDGGNPLGFLTALGAVCLLADEQTGPNAHAIRLHWTAARRPILTADLMDDGVALVKRVAELAQRPAPGAVEAQKEKTTRATFEEARRQERRKREEIKKRRLPRDQRKAVLEAEHAPLAQHAASLRTQWRAARARAVPDPSVSVGLDLNVTSVEFLEHCRDAVDAATPASRRWADLCVSFGVGVEDTAKRMEATPFALVGGSGHQHFLGTAGDLMVACREEHFDKALLVPWVPTDDGSSFRWDPDDDRRYALRAEDPTAGNKPKTLWGANRLAFEALRLFPCVRGRDGIATVGWRHDRESDVWRWPIWSCDLSLAVIASLVASRDVWDESGEARRRLRARGVFSVFQTRRITVGKAPTQKVNFTPAVPVW